MRLVCRSSQCDLSKREKDLCDQGKVAYKYLESAYARLLSKLLCTFLSCAFHGDNQSEFCAQRDTVQGAHGRPPCPNHLLVCANTGHSSSYISEILVATCIHAQVLVAAASANTAGPSPADRNRQLASRMREALATNKAAYKRLKHETLLFRWEPISNASNMPAHLSHAGSQLVKDLLCQNTDQCSSRHGGWFKVR